MKKATFTRLLSVCLSLCIMICAVAGVPAFAAEPQVTLAATAAGFYTDADGVKTGALNFTATVVFDGELESYGIQYLPRNILEDESVTDKPWETVVSGLPVAFESGDSFSAELQDIPEALFADEFAVVAFADIGGVRYTSAPAYAKVEGSADMGTKQRLQCDLNGNFTVLCVADPQSENLSKWTEARNDLENAIKRSNPDFVMIEGDITDSGLTTPPAFWNYFVEPLEERGIAWGVINGNHDVYTMVNHRMYTSFENCLTTRVDAADPNFDVNRPVNYVLPVYANNGEDNVFAIWGMDTGTGNGNGYEGVTAAQVNWYKAESAKLTAANNGKPVTGVMCLHIPLTETIDMYYDSYNGSYADKVAGDVHQPIYGLLYNSVDNGYAPSTSTKVYTTTHGSKVTANSGLDSSTAPENNRGLYAAMKENGDVKIAVFGHQHTVNIAGNYNGIMLSYAGKIGHYDQIDYLTRGGRIIRFNQENPDAFQTSWVAVHAESEDQPVIDVNAQVVTSDILRDTIKAKKYDAFIEAPAKITMDDNSEISVTATPDSVSVDSFTFAVHGIPEKVKVGTQSSYYSLLAYTGDEDPAKAKLLYADRKSDKLTEMKLNVGDLVDGQLYVKFASDGNGAVSTSQIYRFAIIAMNSEGKAINLKPYTQDGAELSANNVASYMIYGGKQLTAEEAVAEGLDVLKAADDSGEFMFRQFRSIVPLN